MPKTLPDEARAALEALQNLLQDHIKNPDEDPMLGLLNDLLTNNDDHDDCNKDSENYATGPDDPYDDHDDCNKDSGDYATGPDDPSLQNPVYTIPPTTERFASFAEAEDWIKNHSDSLYDHDKRAIAIPIQKVVGFAFIEHTPRTKVEVKNLEE